MFVAFGLFIVTCGFTHVMAVINIWKPLYWLSGDVKVITATASVATAVALPLLVPRVFGLIHSAKLSEDRKRAVEAANTELKELYEKVKKMDELKSQFFANVSHELRTPLTLILGPVEKLERSPLEPEQKRGLEIIRRNSELLLKHVNDLLEASRLEAGKGRVEYAVVDLVRLVKVCCSHFTTVASDRQVRFTAELPEQLLIEADGEKLERIMLNLLGNAFKIVPAGGSVTCRISADDQSVRLVVQDTGPGIPPEMREAVFERFRQVEGGPTRPFGGTGLGLSIARDFVELHGGTIRATETPGGGATFTVTLPLKAPGGTDVRPESAEASSGAGGNIPPYTPPAPSAGETGNERDSNPGRAVVLVVEDDPELNRFVSEFLESRYNVVRTHNGREGLEKALEVVPDVILSDIMMPEMSGDRLLEAVRAEEALAEIPFILLSAKTDEDLRLQLLREGASDFIMKPFKLAELEARVANFVTMASARKTLQEELQLRGRDLAELAVEAVRRKQEAERAFQAQREAEEALRRLNAELEERIAARTDELQEANQELHSFTSTVSHDLRAPLRTIQGMACVLLEDYGEQLDEAASDYARRIVHGAERMDTLIVDLLEYSRVSRAELDVEPVSLATVMEEVQQALWNEILSKGASISVEETSVQVFAQHSFLRQAVSNLLGNALKYVAPGVAPQVRVGVREQGERVRLEVKDNGIGIPAEFQERIFERFQRLHSASEYPGTGLGLAIVARAIGRMGGDCGVDSTPGEGSCFWIELRKVTGDGKA